jgi:hypothetical protein
MVATTLRHILNVAFPAYAVTHRLPLRVHKAVSVLRRCRTGGLGWHARKCRRGHVVDFRLNSCRHRVCPQCGWHKREDWGQRLTDPSARAWATHGGWCRRTGKVGGHTPELSDLGPDLARRVPGQLARGAPGVIASGFSLPPPDALPVDEFLDRLFEHVPVKGLHMVRAYGLYNRSEHAALERCRLQLQPRGLQPLPQRPAPIEPERCPRCGASLTLIVSRTPVCRRRLQR